MRIIAGEFRGRTLFAPSGRAVRPTSELVREAIFNILEHGDALLEGARVLDLYAGSGALGLEALSRGASFALFVEEAAQARAAIRRNIETLGLTGRTRIFRRNATRLGPIPAGLKPFDIAFLDPPYDRGLVAPALEGLCGGNWLAHDAKVIVETRPDEEAIEVEGFIEMHTRTYGETRVAFLARS